MISSFKMIHLWWTYQTSISKLISKTEMPTEKYHKHLLTINQYAMLYAYKKMSKHNFEVHGETSACYLRNQSMIKDTRIIWFKLTPKQATFILPEEKLLNVTMWGKEKIAIKNSETHFPVTSMEFIEIGAANVLNLHHYEKSAFETALRQAILDVYEWVGNDKPEIIIRYTNDSYEPVTENSRFK